MTPGRLFYLLYHQPRGWVERCQKEGGPINQWITWRAKKQMASAANRLPPISVPPSDAPKIYFLTGHRYWHQTAFCFWSLCQHSNIPLKAVFIDDGSWNPSLTSHCERLFPGCEILNANDIEDRLDQELPPDRFPTLRSQRSSYIHLRKLTDVHAGGIGPRLVMDSDMLFFQCPDQLIRWLASPDKILHMSDTENAYGYPVDALSSLAGNIIPEKLNVGIFGIRSESIDWSFLEYCCSKLLATYGSSYYLEQALCAILAARQPAERLDPKDYRVMPTSEECLHPGAALYHYVNLSRIGYYRHAWRAALQFS